MSAAAGMSTTEGLIQVGACVASGWVSTHGHAFSQSFPKPQPKPDGQRPAPGAWRLGAAPASPEQPECQGPGRLARGRCPPAGAQVAGFPPQPVPRVAGAAGALPRGGAYEAGEHVLLVITDTLLAWPAHLFPFNTRAHSTRQVPASMQAGGVSGGVASRFGRLPKPEELVEELAQVYYAGLMAELSARHSEEEGDDTKVGGFNVCQLALRFLISAAFDRLLHSSKAVVSIQVRERERGLRHAAVNQFTNAHTNSQLFPQPLYSPYSTSGHGTSTSSTPPPAAVAAAAAARSRRRPSPRRCRRIPAPPSCTRSWPRSAPAWLPPRAAVRRRRPRRCRRTSRRPPTSSRTTFHASLGSSPPTPSSHGTCHCMCCVRKHVVFK